MTTAKRITVTHESVRLALADWHAQYLALPEPQRAERVMENERATHGEFAAAVSGHLFSLLERHAEKTT